jgi:autotransporter-associated beta strand protein
VTVQDSAALTISGSFDIYNGASTGNSTENLNLNGGTTTVGNFLATSGSATHQSRINFNGGILKAATNDPAGSTFLPALAGLVVNVTNTLPAIFVNTNGLTDTIAAVLTNSTANPDGGLTKRGGGTLILSAVNAYNGPTTVSKGVLVVSGSIGAGSVLVNTNGTLGGPGTIGGSVTNAGTLAPGIGNSSAGTTLTINNNLTLQPGSTNIMLVSADNNNNDVVSVSGTITYGGTLVILTNVTDTTSLAGKTFTLFSASGGISGSFNSIQPSPGPGLMWIEDPSNPGQFDVVAAPTTAGFTGTPTNGLAPLQVVFTDASIASYGSSITNWVWSFGDGNGITNTSNANVTNTYAAAGSYTVSLIVTDNTGNSNTNTQTAYIVVQSASQPPVSAFSGTPRNIFVTQTVVFTNNSTGSYTNSAWSFGDENVANLSGSSVSNNVSDIYTNAGNYTVQLIVTGAGGSGTNTQTAYIVVKPKPALGKPVLSGGNFIFTGTNGPAGDQYRILASTNVALPLASWTPVLTNVFASDGSYGYTNSAPTNKASFFILDSP